ncbi:MAG: HNH endonuclease [Streptomyces sp.]|jgi:hypothetical protein|nr:HNH endonuclease [Streptomyces sp.]
MDESTAARFYGKVNKNGPVPAHRPELGPCWVWNGRPSTRGYGYFWFEGKKRLAHRFSYENLVGPIPEGLVIDHLCRNTMCVNAHGHLEPVTDRVNILRGEAPPARNVLKDSCGRGHPLDEENTYLYPNGERGCRTCRAKWVKEWRDAQRETSAVPMAERTHCPEGHPYDEANTKINARGHRLCRTCIRIRDREAKRALRARRKAAEAG